MYTFILECRRQFFRRNVVVVGLLLVFALLISLIGISEYNRMKIKISDFKKNDALLINSLNNNEVYSEVGLNVAIIPAPTLILMTNPVMSTSLYGKVNSIITLDMDIKYKGRWNASLKSAFPLQPSSTFLYLGLLAVLVLGFETTWKKEYLKFLASNSSRRKALFSAIAARLVFIFCGFAVIFGGVLLLLVISGIPIFNELSVLFAYAIASLIMLFISFLAGSILGNVRSVAKVIVSSFALWFVFVLLIPSLINKIIDMQNEKMDSLLVLNAKHFKILMDFEGDLTKKYVAFRNLPIEQKRQIAEGFFKNNFQQMIAIEKEYLRQLGEVNKQLENLSVLTPTGLYILTTHEASSMGYGNMLNFYRDLIQKRIAFMRHWINQVYYSSSKEVKSFVTKDENLFRMHSRVPDAFGKGVLINMVYFLILLFGADFFNKKAISPAMPKKGMFDKFVLKLKSGSIFSFTCSFPDVPEQFYNTLFTGHPSTPLHGKIFLNEKDITRASGMTTFYLPAIETIPQEIKVNALLDRFKTISPVNPDAYKALLEKLSPILTKRFDQLEPYDKADVLLSLVEIQATPPNILLMSDFPLGLPLDDLKDIPDRVYSLNEQGVLVLSFCSVQLYDFLFQDTFAVRVTKKDNYYLNNHKSISTI